MNTNFSIKSPINSSEQIVGDKNVLWFSDNRLLPLLFGEHDKFIARIEESLNLRISSRGNRISIVGEKSAVALATTTLRTLYQRLEKNLSVDNAEVDAAIRLASDERSTDKKYSILKEDISIRTPKAIHMPRSVGQVEYMHSLAEKQMIFGLGPAGTGKTYLAVAMAVAMLIGGEVDRIILSRPAVEAGERLGFLPGDLKEKIDPYLAPLFDALHDMLPANQVMNRLGSGEIEVAPLAFMRGRTLSHSCVILDEGQNATKTQMKMFLTRIGEDSKMIITGDPSQVDLPSGVASGLNHAVHLLKEVEGVSVVRFGSEDVVRSRLVANIVRAYESDEEQKG